MSKFGCLSLPVWIVLFKSCCSWAWEKYSQIRGSVTQLFPWRVSVAVYFGCCRWIKVSFITWGVGVCSVFIMTHRCAVSAVGLLLLSALMTLWLIAALFLIVRVQSSLDYPTAAVTRKTPIPALRCLHIAHCCVMPTLSQKFRPRPLRLSAGSTTLSCPLFPPRPALSRPVREKQGRGRAGSTASGRRRGTRAASGRLCCPGRALAWDRTKGYAQRTK